MQIRKHFIFPIALAAVIGFAGAANAESFTISGDGFPSFRASTEKGRGCELVSFNACVQKIGMKYLYACKKSVDKARASGSKLKVVATDRKGYPVMCHMNRI